MPEYLKICEEAARAGGVVLQEKLGQVTAREKAPADLVTEADLAAQQAIRRILLEAFPDHGFLGEETAQTIVPCGPDEYRWIVDPLDGTTNYVHGVPFFSVSIGLQHGSEPVLGVVFHPMAEECFTAEAGKGAWLNGHPIHTSSVTEPKDALGAVGLPPGVAGEDSDVKAFVKTLPHCQALRRTGSAALNLCYIGCGRFDAGWCFSTKIWDVAAGVLIIREAGGMVTSPEGTPFDLLQGRFLAAANEPLHLAFRTLLADC